MSNTDHIMLRNVRVSFPWLYRRPVINGEEGKCGATLMLEPDAHAETLQQLRAGIKALIAQAFKGQKIPADKLCLRNGEDKGRPEYEGYYVLSASNRNKPYVVTNDGSGIITDENDCKIYAGCRVNAKVRLWPQNNQFGKRINAELISIQFQGDDEPLDSAYVSVEDAISGFDVGDDAGGDDFLGDAPF